MTLRTKPHSGQAATPQTPKMGAQPAASTPPTAETAPAPPPVKPPTPPSSSPEEQPGKVGYGSPPKHTQFKPGQSGNPKGRPKRPPTLQDVIAKELAKVVTVVLDGKPTKLTSAEVIIKALVRKAMNGDLVAARVVLSDWKQLLPQEKTEAAVSDDEIALLKQLLADNDDGDVEF